MQKLASGSRLFTESPLRLHFNYLKVLPRQNLCGLSQMHPLALGLPSMASRTLLASEIGINPVGQFRIQGLLRVLECQ